MWDNLLSALAGGVLGAGGAIGSQWLTHHLSDRRTRRAIAGAFAGEIGAICSIIRRRKYLEFGRQLLERIRQTRELLRVKMHLTQEYLTIYHGNSSAIGLLPAAQALDVARFYTQVKSLMEDVRPELPEPVDADEAMARLIAQIELLTETLAIGEALVVQLQKVAQ